METIYLCIVIFLLCLAVFDLFVGVSNDAVNFLQSAVRCSSLPPWLWCWELCCLQE